MANICKVSQCRNEPHGSGAKNKICDSHWYKLPLRYRRELGTSLNVAGKRSDRYRDAFKIALDNLEMRDRAESVAMSLGIPASRVGYRSGRIKPEKFLDLAKYLSEAYRDAT